MDVYMEELVKKKKTGKDYLITVGLVVLAIVLSFVLFFVIMLLSASMPQIGQIAGSIGMLLIAGVWYGAYFLNNSLSIEYEYIVINSSLDIDKIMAKKRRKRMVSLDIKDVALMACIDDNENNHIYKHRDAGVKVVNLSANNNNMNTYFIDHTVDGRRQLVLFQPTSKMVEELYKFNPRIVKKYNI